MLKEKGSDDEIYDLKIPEPEEIVDWLENVTDGAPGNYTSDRAIDMLVRSYNHKKRTWEKAEEHLRGKKLLSTLKPEITRRAKLNLRETLHNRRRVQVDEKREDPDFEIVEVTKYTTKGSSPVYDLTVGCREGEYVLENMTAQELLTKSKFEARFFEVANRVPVTGKAETWKRRINEQMQTLKEAGKIEEVESHENIIETLIISWLNDWPVVEDPEDIRGQNTVYCDDEYSYVSFSALVEALEQRRRRISDARLAALLHRIGLEGVILRFEGKRYRCWRYKRPVQAEQAPRPAEQMPLTVADPNA